MVGEANVPDPASPAMAADVGQPTAGRRAAKERLIGHGRVARGRLEPLTNKARSVLTDENARSLARQAKTLAQSEQAAKAAKVIGGLVVSAIVTQHLKPGGVAQGAVVAAARAAGLSGDGSQPPPARKSTKAATSEGDNSTPSWQPPRGTSVAAEGGRYPTAPALLHLGFSGSGYLFKHPELPDLWVESTLLGLSDPAVSFEWAPAGARRSHMRGPEISASWAPVECSGQLLPLELRRVTNTDIEFRWLEPTPAQRSVTTLFRPPPVDGQVAYLRMKTALNAMNNRSPRWHA